MSPSTLAWRCLLPHTAGPLARSSHAMAVVGTTVRVEIVGARTVGSSVDLVRLGCLWLDNICARPHPHKIYIINTPIYIYIYTPTSLQAYLFGGENVPRVPVDARLHTLNLMFAGEGGEGAKWEQLVGGLLGFGVGGGCVVCRLWSVGLRGCG